MNTATVYLIGAGPGDPGLLTLRGREVLGLADVLVYDFLANSAFLRFARPDAERIYVGKRGGAHTLTQDKINELLVELGRAGKTVARLKGGDPYIFGRGGEEAAALAAAGVAFEVVPGVTAGSAVAAYAGIPVTQRGLASSVAFITGHEDAEKGASAHNWQALAQGPETLVFYMGVKNLPEISARLLEAGMPGERPAAIVEWGTTPRQKTLLSTLADLPKAASDSGISAPALLIVGEVAALRESLQWYETKPLFGRSIVVTRSREQAGELTARLAVLGAEVMEFPCIEVLPLPETSMIHGAIGRLFEYHWVVFTSANGVKFFWDELAALGKDARAFTSCRVAAIGPGTAAALAGRGITADFIPESFVAESVAQGMIALGVAGSRILIPRAVSARDVLPQSLERAGAEVRVLPVYEAKPSFNEREALEEALARGEVDCVTFASSSTVDNFFAGISPKLIKEKRARAEADGGAGKAPRFACIGPITRATLESYGFTCDIEPAEYTIDALAQAVADFYKR